MRKQKRLYPPTAQEVLRQAIQQAGGVPAVTAHFEFSYTSTVHNWISASALPGRGIPSQHVKKLCAMKGVTVTPNQLRPDIF